MGGPDPLVKEYSLNYDRVPYMVSGIFLNRDKGRVHRVWDFGLGLARLFRLRSLTCFC